MFGTGRSRAKASKHLAQINAANCSPPDSLVPEFYRRAAPVLLDDDLPLRFYVGYVDGESEATAEATVGAGVVGLCNISTLTSWRGAWYRYGPHPVASAGSSRGKSCHSDSAGRR